MTALYSYSTGTVSVAADGTTVTGVGPIWTGTNARPGDILQIGDFQSIITDVTDMTHLVIPPWGGGVQSAAAYKIWQVSPQRFAGAQAMQSVNDLVAALDTSGFFVFVGTTETVPDPSLGDDGQYAFQPTTGKTWAKVAGVWTFLGIYKAFQLLGAWSGVTAYAAGDVVTLSGSSYVCVLDHTNHTPPNVTYWQLLASKGDTGATGSTGAAGTNGTNGAGYGGTSTTSLAIGTGSKAFTTQAGLAYANGARVRASSAANTSNWMEGRVTYSGTTLTMTSDKVGGSGTLADWNLNVVGEPGAGDLSSANNLSDVASAATAATNLGVVRYAAAQSLTAANRTQARSNISAALRGQLWGLTLSAAGGNGTAGIAAGEAADSTAADLMVLASAITKTTSNWAVGSGNGGMMTSALAGNSWYNAWLIKRPDTGVVDFVWDLVANGSTNISSLASGAYTEFRRIGCMKTDGSNFWVAFTQVGDKFLWAVPTQDDTSAVGTTAALVRLNVPPAQVDAEIFGLGVNTASGTTWAITSPDQTDTLPSTAFFTGIVGAASVNVTYSQTVRTNASGQIRKRASAASTTIYINTFSWIDRRGRDA
ncbi:hypothetical protein IVB27_35485 [Bradyrhizobium sp. 197]|uniref:hypothetical protein n=1 Tax=Bradyrhizobium sp. 197 TaxID=2782663 RepID=UPI001FFB247F|nr:hypothetical protein [Bradyrhizobium sp. 197]MCK1479904.1 hypothetical protein [Bradyrhizobium sp. 197]